VQVFSVSQGLNWVGKNFAGLQEAKKIVERGGCLTVQECCHHQPGLDCDTNYFESEYPGAGRFVVAHALQAVGYVLLLMFWEEKLADRVLNVLKRWVFASRYVAVPTASDEDVEAEAKRVQEGQAVDSDIVIDNVRKAFKLGSIKAIDGVSLGISPGECFGLLGVNGAGKTTLFKVRCPLGSVRFDPPNLL
jgi:ABC-type multidrug transport system fused ATPase/permease subunit